MRKLAQLTSSIPRFVPGLAISVLLLSVCSFAQDDGDLQKVLDQLDEAAKKFRTAQANFVWTQYNKVINDVADTQKGKIYLRRTGKETQMAANITEDRKSVV